MKRLNSSIMGLAVLIGASTVMAADMDNQIENSFKNSYTYKTYLKDDSISMDSKNGVVTLKGKVVDASHRSLAEETAAELPGVKKVDNQLAYGGDKANDSSDTWLATKIKSTLLFHKNVSATSTQVDVKNGVAFLKGTAENEAQKDLTAEYARSVEGVKDVKNDITVNPPNNANNAGNTASVNDNRSIGETIDDSSITAQVKLTLMYHKSTSAMRTSVKTKDGVVTLRGKAQNPAERDLVTKLVSDVKGVKSVNNEMTVENKA